MSRQYANKCCIWRYHCSARQLVSGKKSQSIPSYLAEWWPIWASRDSSLVTVPRWPDGVRLLEKYRALPWTSRLEEGSLSGFRY